MRYLISSILFALNCSCTTLPSPPQTPLCLFDNYTEGGKKAPVFACETSNGVKFDIPWHSESAKNMVATPFDDYVKLNAYYQKVFSILEKQLLKKAGK